MPEDIERRILELAIALYYGEQCSPFMDLIVSRMEKEIGQILLEQED